MSVARRRCRLARAVLPFVDGELPTDEALRFEDHLDGCASCSASVQAQRALEESLVALPQPRLLLPDRARLLAGIRQRIEEHGIVDHGIVAGVRAPLRRIAGIAVAAAAAIALAGFAFLRGGAPGGGVPASSPAPVETASGATTTADAAATIDTLPAPEAPPPPDDPLFTTADESALNGALLLAAHDELARILRGLASHSNAIASDDLLTSFAAATQPMRAAGIPLPVVMRTVLSDPDATLAGAAADLLARAAARGDVRRDDPVLVPMLESLMRRPDRGAAMLRVLVAIGSPRAWDAVGRAVRMGHLRPLALRALAERGDPASLPTLQAELALALREPDGADLVAAIVATLPVHRVEQLQLLASLARSGVPADAIAATLARAQPAVTALLESALADRNAAVRRDALRLALIARDDALAPALAALVAHGEEVAAALDVLGQTGGARTLAALLRVGASGSLPNSRARSLAAAFSSALDATADVAPALALTLALEPGAEPLLVEFCRLAPGRGGRAARAALLVEPSLQRPARAALALALATRRERIAPETLAALLADAAASRAPDGRDDGLTASLLVLLYSSGGDDGLAQGLRTLGLQLRPPGQERLRNAARLVVNGPDARRDLARVDALLNLAP